EDRDEGRDGGAILGRLAEHIIGSPNMAGTRHVLGHDRRLAGNMAGEMARDDARVGIEPASDPGADDELDVLAALGIRLSGGRRGKWSRGEPCQNAEAQWPSKCEHESSLTFRRLELASSAYGRQVNGADPLRLCAGASGAQPARPAPGVLVRSLEGLYT